MIAPLLMMASLLAPQDPTSSHHLTPIPIINADLSSDRNLFVLEPADGGSSAILTPIGTNSAVTLRRAPYPPKAAPTPEAVIEVARERELRDQRFLAIEPGATAILLLETESDLFQPEPGARYACSWAEGTAAEAGSPELVVSLQSEDGRKLLGTVSDIRRDSNGRWKRSHATLQIDSEARGRDAGALLCLHNPADARGTLFIDNLTLARVGTDSEEFTSLFNGRDLTGWTGSKGTSKDAFVVEDGAIRCNPNATHGNNLLTEDTFDDFILHFEFTVPPAGNNGIALRAPLSGDPAFAGLEAQVLDTIHPGYINAQPWQTHGSIYGIAPAKRGFQRPTGAWNQQSIHVKGREVVVILNGETILEANLDAAVENGTLSGQEHPGLSRSSGHLGFCGHGHPVAFRNIRIKTLDPQP